MPVANMSPALGERGRRFEDMLSVTEIEAARQRLKGAILETPAVRADLSEMSGVRCYSSSRTSR